MRAPALVAGLLLLSFGCSKKAIDFDGRTCDVGTCLEGYACHPENQRCVPEIAFGCATPEDLCPSETGAGDECAEESSFIPCVDYTVDCSEGCRTCQHDGTWSLCSHCLPSENPSCADDGRVFDGGDARVGDPGLGDAPGDPLQGDAGDPGLGDPTGPGDTGAGDAFKGDAPTSCASPLSVRPNDFSTTDASFVDVPGATLTVTPTDTSEVWIVLFSAGLSGSESWVNPEVRYLVNGTERGFGSADITAANTWAPWMHFDRISGTTSAQTLQVQLRTNSSEAKIRGLRIVAFPLPPGAEHQYAANESARTVPADQWQTFESLSFTPNTAGKYLLLGLANATEYPSGATIGLRFTDSLGGHWPEPSGAANAGKEHFSNPRIPRQTFFWARAQSLSAGTHTFTIDAHGGGNSSGMGLPDSTISYTRLLAFRLDAFGSYQSVEDLAETTTTATIQVTKSTLITATPPGDRHFIQLQSVTLGGGGLGRIVTMATDGTPTTDFNHDINNIAYRTSYGLFALVRTSASATYTTAIGTSAATNPVEVKESIIHLLELPCAP